MSSKEAIKESGRELPQVIFSRIPFPARDQISLQEGELSRR